MTRPRPPSWIALGLLGLALACGRTELDLPGGGTGGRAGGAGGRAGMSGGASGAGGAAAFACGALTCAPAETCCVGASGPVCTDAKTPCAGLAVSCLDGSSCGSGRVCCVSLLARGTQCETASACTAGLGVVVCSTGAECPSASPTCCLVSGNRGLCSAQACP